MKYSHIVFCGDSYMKSYVDSGGHLQLCEKLAADPILVYRSGSAHEYVMNHLYNKISQCPHALVVWGLTHTSRIDVPFKDPQTKKSMWATLNYDHLVGDDKVHYFHHIKKGNPIFDTFTSYLSFLLSHNELYLEKSLQQISYVAGWLKQRNHNYIIWNQASEDLRNINLRQWPVMEDIKRDQGFCNIFNWCMNEHLRDKGVPLRPADLAYYKNQWNIAAHLDECQELNDETNKFILENLTTRNLI